MPQRPLPLLSFSSAALDHGAAYPFTRLRADGVWVLDYSVRNDLVGPLASQRVSCRFDGKYSAI